MSGEQRLRILGLVALVTICTIFIISSLASAEEGGNEDESTVLLDKANENHECYYRWDSDIDVTYKITVANAGNAVDYFGIGEINEYTLIVNNTLKWSIDNYDDGVPIETQGLMSRMDYRILEDYNEGEFVKFRGQVQDDLLASQDPDGSWNQDPGDTAMALYGLSSFEDENIEAINLGIEWIRKQEDPDTHSWGTIEEDSKAILALSSAGLDVWDEIAVLLMKQKPDGSFGGIEETSWAVLALSMNPNKETIKSMEKAVAWLRSQDYENEEDLALAALAEQYYENSRVQNSKVQQDREESGFIPPPWMYGLSIFIIGSLTLSYWLFAKLNKEQILDGVRKDLYLYITEHPGEHLANIRKEFNLSSSSARYHLTVLESMDKIVSHKSKKFKRFYINKNGYSKYTNGNGYKHIMSALKNVTARKIVKFLLVHPNSNQKSISNALDIHPSTVNWHAERLKHAEVISKSKNGKEILYTLNEDVQVRKVIGILEGVPA
jgi:predicted transcriptional regulator